MSEREFQSDWFTDRYVNPAEGVGRLQRVVDALGLDGVYDALERTAETAEGRAVLQEAVSFVDIFSTKCGREPINEERIAIRKAAATGAIMALRFCRLLLKNKDVDPDDYQYDNGKIRCSGRDAKTSGCWFIPKMEGACGARSGAAERRGPRESNKVAQ